MKRRGIMKVTYELLEDMLKLDGDHHVVSVQNMPEDSFNDTFSVILSGPTCPEIPEGGVGPRVVLDNEGGVR